MWFESVSYKQRVGRGPGVRSLLLLACLVSVFIFVSCYAPNDNGISRATHARLMAAGKAAIDDYLRSHDMSIDKRSEDYRAFLRQVLNDAHPELMTPDKAEAVTYYAIKTLGLAPDTVTGTSSP